MGTAVRKRSFVDHGPTAVATAFRHDGKIVAVWPDQSGWEGDFGRLTATRI